MGGIKIQTLKNLRGKGSHIFSLSVPQGNKSGTIDFLQQVIFSVLQYGLNAKKTPYHDIRMDKASFLLLKNSEDFKAR